MRAGGVDFRGCGRADAKKSGQRPRAIPTTMCVGGVGFRKMNPIPCYVGVRNENLFENIENRLTQCQMCAIMINDMAHLAR